MSASLPPTVRAALQAAGWRPDARDPARARTWSLTLAGYAAPDGRRHVVVPPAVEVFAGYGGLRVPAGASGEHIAPSGFHLDPTLVLHSVATLATLGDVLGTSLTPLGDEGDGTGILAIDAAGRVFALDHGGEWFLGAGIEEALTTLVMGIQPARLRADGTW